MHEFFRTYSPELVDLFVNHPAIRPNLEPFDGSRISSFDLVSDPRNVFVVGEHGCAMFEWLQPCVYEGHIGILPDQRGSWGLRLGTAALNLLFGTLEAKMVVARIPVKLPAARMFVRRLGFRSNGVDSGGDHELFEYGGE